MRGMIIGQDQENYLVSGDSGKRYQFAIWDWLGKKPPKAGDAIDFVCEGDAIKSIVPLLVQQERSEQSQVLLAFVCFFGGVLGLHSFMVGQVGTGALMLLLTLTVFWAFIDFIVIITGIFTDSDGARVKS
ncbi:hypothetical protein MCO_00188 [Bartonella sp. DB5-6]|uniref:TM2 domain-containing protein n=1 Tax=Bartonella sp. DB5-6 TaxID=1094755 RepID=UPI00026E8F72|nr:TM2 domain-containing protein [Bartonella sp. DB5-6]EJF80674.1 hypothetical protein MCO_00188 [Bartonella sp. DB5-6]